MTTPRIDDAQIAEAAFFIWLEEGQPAGREVDHWLRAQDALSTPVAKPAKRKAAPKKAAAKPAAKTAAKPAAKTAAKPAAKTAAKPKAVKPRARKAAPKA